MKIYNLSFLLFRHLFIRNHNGISSYSNITINITTKINLHNITSSKLSRFTSKRRIMANNIIHRNTSRESNTFFNILILEDAFTLLLNKKITKSTDIRNKLSSYTLHLIIKRIELLER